jgi:hypothetical protein
MSSNEAQISFYTYKKNKCMRQNIFKPHNEKYEKVLNLGGFWPPTPGEMTRPGPFSMGGETLTPQRCIPNMKTIPSKLWSVALEMKQFPAAAETAADGTKTKVSPT